jgi:hypothetical protein
MRKLLILALVGVFAALGTAAVAGAKSRDRDRDRLPDTWEKKFKLSTSQKSTRQDNDKDGLNNLGEFETGNNPRDDDSDDDGVEDGDENAGVIESFDPATGKLVIALAPNGRIEGKVDGTTEIECENRSGHDNSGPGSDNSGPGSDNSGPGSGDSGRDDDGEDRDEDDCTTAALVKGAKVEEAELRGNGIFEEIELDS